MQTKRRTEVKSCKTKVLDTYVNLKGRSKVMVVKETFYTLKYSYYALCTNSCSLFKKKIKVQKYGIMHFLFNMKLFG